MSSRDRLLRASWLPLLLVLATGCGSEPRPNVLLISLDTTRADRIGAYGFDGVSTPVIDALADDGVLFEQCSTVAPLTVPAHASLMTGTYPFVHGVRDNGRYRLAGESLTLAEVLAESGWATAAQVGVFVLNRGTGLEQGFGSYRDTSDRAPTVPLRNVPLSRRETNELSADRVTDGALDWLRSHDGGPFFLFAHYFDPHAPYEPPEPYLSAHASSDRPPALDRYLGEIARVDHEIGRLLAALDELGYADDTLVVLTADHGEAFGEHREIGHSYFVYDTTTRVPLIVRLPGMLEAGRRVPDQVRLVDVAPTILDLVGAPPLPDAHGVSLLGHIRGVSSDRGLFAYAETLAPLLDYRYSPLVSLRTEQWKYIRAPKEELYRLADDPRETTNVIDEHPDVAAGMRGRLDRLLEAAPAAAGGRQIDPSVRARLESLGYLGGGGAPSDGRLHAGADPKDRIDEMTQASTALRAFHDGDLARAGEIYAALAAKDPANTLFLAKLAETRFGEGRLEEAAGHYRALAELDPSSPTARRGLANVAMRQGDAVTARSHLAELTRISPTDVRAWLDLGNLEAASGDLASAAGRFRQAIEIDPRNPEALVLLARTDLLAGRHGEAAVSLESAVRSPDAPDEARLQLAWLLATSPEPALRDGPRALELARSRPARSVVARLVIAAALAETGDHQAALAELAAARSQSPATPRDGHWLTRMPTIEATLRQGLAVRSREPL